MLRPTPTMARHERVDHACGCCEPGRTCDGLECLCRPRFFAGQLLTDDDLRRLDHYIVAKQRLHNRYLHGTGVACGLEVVCNPCDPTVTVRPGYAIGPCGEDIVVCRDAAVPIAELVLAHRRQRTVDCDPYGGRPAEQDCEAARQRWILAICYDERPARGVTSLRRAEPAKCACRCGSGSGEGNGGGNGWSASASNHHADACSCVTPPARVPAQCEPTVTCEGYRFVLLKEPPAPREPVRDRWPSAVVGPSAPAGKPAGDLADRVRRCLFDLTSRLQQLGQAGNSTAALVEVCCELKAELREIIETGTVHDCMLGARLNLIICPDPAGENAGPQALDAIQQLLLIAIELFKSCVCSALLPPCDVGSPDDCIPLATLTVRTADLRVLDICNWSSRRFAVSFPMLGYWFGWLPIFDTLRAAIARLCCEPTRRTFQLNDNLKVRAMGDFEARREPMTPEGAAAEGAQPRPTPAGRGAPGPSALLGLATQYVHRANPLSGLEATLLAALGVTADDDTALASDLELGHPFEALALTRLAARAAVPTLPDDFTPTVASVLRDVLEREARRPEERDVEARERVERLEAAVESLEKTTRSQARTIGKLRKQVEER